MTKLINIKCPNCGAPINKETLHCDYCGSEFRWDEQHVRLITIRDPRVLTFKARADIVAEALDALGESGAAEYAKDMLCEGMVEAVKENMEIYSDYDPCLNVFRCAGVLRLVPPNTKL